MSQFSDAFAGAFDTSYSIFGDDCTIAATTYSCVVHDLDLAGTVRPGLSAGRGLDVSGTVILRKVDWLDAVTRLEALGKKGKGAQITLPGGTFRIINYPDIAPTSDTVRLLLGPLA